MIEACFRLVEFTERLRLEGVERPLSVWSRYDKARFTQDSQARRHTGLVNSRCSNNVVELLLTMPQRFHDATTRRISPSLNCDYGHIEILA